MFKYILEIKNRLFLLTVTWVSMVSICYLYKEILLFLFLESEIFSNNQSKLNYFIFTDIIEVFSVYFQLILFFSFQILILYIIYHFFTFFSYSLFGVEYYYVKYILKTVIIVWFMSVFLSKYFLIPAMWNFFLTFQTSSHINLYFEAKLSEYLNFSTKFYYIFVVYCQIFTILIFFFNYINANILLIKKFRKLYYYFFVLFSTLVSPPDITSQFFVSFVLIFCYEVFILIFIVKHSFNLLIRQPVKPNKYTCC